MITEPNKLDTIKNIIELNELDSKSRKRDKVYKRFYLYNELRSMPEFKSLEWIGDMFNRDHSSVVHGLSTHDILIEMKDVMYKGIIFEMNQLLGNTTIDKNKVLRDRIRNCKNLYDYKTVKHLVTSGQL